MDFSSQRLTLFFTSCVFKSLQTGLNFNLLKQFATNPIPQRTWAYLMHSNFSTENIHIKCDSYKLPV